MLLPLLEEACPEVLIALREAGIPEKEWLAPKAPGYRQELFDALEADDRIAWYLWAGPFDAVTAASVERWSHHGRSGSILPFKIGRSGSIELTSVV